MTYNGANYQIIILAAGKGTRMESDLPRVMHKVGGVPMLETVLKNSLEVTNDIVIVYSEELKKYLTPYENMCRFVLQKEPKGTAHAACAAIDLIDENKIILVLCGDHPLITPKLMHELIDYLSLTNSALVTLSFERENPAWYGRIATDKNGDFLEIIEYKNASEEEKKIKLCNSGIMAFSRGVLNKYLPLFATNTTGNKEVYLTEIVKICKNHGEKVSYLLSTDHALIVGVNNKNELEEANNIFSKNNC
ncbi:MAG: NTP transferase domain-containing protein [Rickettsia endosymbiont of Ixodes persulcatus]|nr:NTP transferase domain-containing protein [Rickettsia endosymbiont of Ixodes persulcatus]MCZ6908894.1 NTP transferase domain-containing protein [Rickettsia endosymbiont of Ixodes persulcatus]MCZ6913738.1 NTP transferase domain-containing protein [Rickettsia endosymbiont of Ixodes persulcatus]MCZ6919974.1 NTP transferase domain-containing protein [Rickettsia endosymbiont of Ixodes persulcatus]MCZ6925197.1 NTP transferase domain-containing protein [Rickettsia endosymbiont of Ixodes persulcatus